MKYIICGLGNPGKKHEKNRHNVGFMVIDKIAEEFSLSFGNNFSSSFVKFKEFNKDIILVKPLLFMNNSGISLFKIASYFHVETKNIIVIHDDLDIIPFSVKIKKGGGTGGHNGLKSVFSHFGEDFIRIRIGVGRPEDKNMVANYLLSNFFKKEDSNLKISVQTAKDAALSVVKEGLDFSMNSFNKNK